jgi:sec-independent protein translocase protein TatA
MPDLGPWEILIIAVVILVLFGAKKMPDAARSLGRSMRIFKTEIKGLHDDDQPAQPQPAQPQPAQPQPAQPQQLTAAPGAPSVEQQAQASPIGDNVDGR